MPYIYFFKLNILVLGMELPWYAKPAVILGKFYPEITIKKVFKEEKLPPYLPKGLLFNRSIAINQLYLNLEVIKVSNII
jgi:hypothetical protein